MPSPSNKNLLFFSLIISLVLKSLITVHYFNISGDKILQVAAAKQMAEGKAYTMPVVSNSVLLLRPILLWPPGYSALLAPIIFVTKNASLSALILDLSVGISFIVILFALLGLMNFPPLITALILLFQSTQIHAAIADSASTDLISLNCWLLAILFLISYLASGKSKAAILFILFISLQPWLRYANIPLVMVLPVALVAYGIWNKKHRQTKAGLTALIFSVISVVALLSFNYTRSGHLLYALPSEKGFFPSNLFQLPPVTFMSILNIDFLLTQLSLRLGISYSALYTSARIVNFIFLGSLILYLAGHIRRFNKTGQKPSNAALILAACALIAVASLTLLAWLSISRNRQYNINECWTFIEEQRYMLLITFSIMLFLLHHFLSICPLQQTRTTKLFGVLLVMLMTAEAAHGIWIIAKGPYPSLSHNAYLNNLPLTKQFITGLQKSDAIVLADEDYDLRGYGILLGIPVFNHPTEINKPNIKINQKIVLRIRPGHEPLFPGFFSHQHIEDLGRIEGYSFYALNPGNDE